MGDVTPDGPAGRSGRTGGRRTQARRVGRQIGRRRRRWVGVLAGLAVLAVVGGLTYPQARSRFWPTTYEAPERADLPPLTERDGTSAYLTGPGQTVVQLRTVTADLTGNDAPSPAMCTTVMADRVPALGTPQDVATAIAQIPDQATAEMAWSYLDALRRWLPSCAIGAAEPRDELRFTAVILDRRLAEVS